MPKDNLNQEVISPPIHPLEKAYGDCLGVVSRDDYNKPEEKQKVCGELVEAAGDYLSCRKPLMDNVAAFVGGTRSDEKTMAAEEFLGIIDRCFTPDGEDLTATAKNEAVNKNANPVKISQALGLVDRMVGSKICDYRLADLNAYLGTMRQAITVRESVPFFNSRRGVKDALAALGKIDPMLADAKKTEVTEEFGQDVFTKTSL